MRIIAKKTLVLFYQSNKDAETALEDWYEKTEKAEWDNFAQIKRHSLQPILWETTEWFLI